MASYMIPLGINDAQRKAFLAERWRVLDKASREGRTLVHEAVSLTDPYLVILCFDAGYKVDIRVPKASDVAPKSNSFS